jgi:hypothetical protein
LESVASPTPFFAGFVHPPLHLRKYCRKIDIEVTGLSYDRRRTADSAAGINQIRRIQELAAVFALISPCLLVTAVRTGASNVTVRKKHLAPFTKQLFDGTFTNVIVFIQLEKDILGNLRVVRSGGPAKSVKFDIEPFIDV